MKDTRIFKRGVLTAAMAAVVAITACDDEGLMQPNVNNAIFARYVSFGNSLTAGFQSGGINDSTQLQSYAVLLAAQMGTSFGVPLLNSPGCPPPLINIFTQEALPDPTGTGCTLRKANVPEVINNVAVPGAQVLDILSNLAPGNSANPLTTFLLGGLTQFEMARRAQPTFATVWIGNNDALDAATSGNPALLTPAATFDAQYRDAVDSITGMGVQGGVLIGVVKVTAAPFLTAGVSFFGASMTPTWPATFTVSANCAPAAFGGQGETTLVPFTYGFGVLFGQALAGVPVTLDCVNDAPVLATAELGAVTAAVTAYNSTIQSVANEIGWAYWDPNTLLDSIIGAGGIPPFPNAPPSPTADVAPFGTFLSRDGIHPSALTHRLITNDLIGVINAKYGTDMATVPIP